MFPPDAEYMKLAYAEAVKSGDLSTQNGAILVDPMTGGILVRGRNDIYPTHCNTPERRARPLKYEWTEHAERSVIYAAAKAGIRTDGKWLYCPWLACADCGRAIFLAGITRVVRHKIAQHDTRPDWAASIATADEMFKAAGVRVDQLDMPLGVRFRFNGVEIEV